MGKKYYGSEKLVSSPLRGPKIEFGAESIDQNLREGMDGERGPEKNKENWLNDEHYLIIRFGLNLSTRTRM